MFGKKNNLLYRIEVISRMVSRTLIGTIIARDATIASHERIRGNPCYGTLIVGYPLSLEDRPTTTRSLW